MSKGVSGVPVICGWETERDIFISKSRFLESVAPPAGLERAGGVESMAFWVRFFFAPSNKGPSLSTHARTRKMVIYACVGAKPEETLVEALV